WLDDKHVGMSTPCDAGTGWARSACIRDRNRGLGTGIRELGTGIRELGTGIREPGTAIRELGTAIRELGTGIREPGTANGEPGTCTVERLSDGDGRGALPDAARAGENRRGRQRAPLDRSREQRRQPAMAFDVSEGHLRVARALPPPLRFGEARRSAKREGGSP